MSEVLVSLVQYTHQLSKTQLWRLLWKHLKSQGQNLKNLNSQSLIRHRPIRTFVRPYPIRKFVVIQVDTGSQEKGSNQNFVFAYLVCVCFPIAWYLFHLSVSISFAEGGRNVIDCQIIYYL